MTLLETRQDVAALDVPAGETGTGLGFVTQTTLSVDDTADIIHALKERFPDIIAPAAESICYATTNRQEAVKAAAPGTDLFLVVGAENSSNSKRLVEAALRAGARQAFLVADVAAIDWESVPDGPLTIGLSAGASAPEVLVEAIIEAFRARYDLTVELATTTVEDEEFLVMRDLRSVPLEPADMAFVNGPATGRVSTDPVKHPETV